MEQNTSMHCRKVLSHMVMLNTYRYQIRNNNVIQNYLFVVRKQTLALLFFPSLNSVTNLFFLVMLLISHLAKDFGRSGGNQD